jgi:hypothetical protein
LNADNRCVTCGSGCEVCQQGVCQGCKWGYTHNEETNQCKKWNPLWAILGGILGLCCCIGLCLHCFKGANRGSTQGTFNRNGYQANPTYTHNTGYNARTVAEPVITTSQPQYREEIVTNTQPQYVNREVITTTQQPVQTGYTTSTIQRSGVQNGGYTTTTGAQNGGYTTTGAQNGGYTTTTRTVGQPGTTTTTGTRYVNGGANAGWNSNEQGWTTTTQTPAQQAQWSNGQTTNVVTRSRANEIEMGLL